MRRLGWLMGAVPNTANTVHVVTICRACEKPRPLPAAALEWVCCPERRLLGDAQLAQIGADLGERRDDLARRRQQIELIRRAGAILQPVSYTHLTLPTN